MHEIRMDANSGLFAVLRHDHRIESSIAARRPPCAFISSFCGGPRPLARHGPVRPAHRGSDRPLGRRGLLERRDAQKVTQQARGFCSQPYVITRAPAGGAVMFEPFDGTRREVLVQSGQIVAASGDSRSAKTVSSLNGQVPRLQLQRRGSEAKYGNMVFVRCGR